MTRTGFETGLFSATVGAFIIEFYKKLSSDPGDETVALLVRFLSNFKTPQIAPILTLRISHLAVHPWSGSTQCGW
jgi:Family of unknown function (DUF6535)